MVQLEKIISSFQDRLKKLTNEKKRRLILVCTAGVVVILILSVIMYTGNSTQEEIPAEIERVNLRAVIPAEDIFLPEEPDFIPGILLEREQRLTWSEEDAMEHWQDPLRYGEEEWRENIEAAINIMLERVP